jgi:hypothetical protein
MTGWFGNRISGHGGRGRGRGGSTTTKTKKTVEDYFFYVASSKQASDYEITAEFIVNHIKKKFDRGNDISEALRTLVKANTSLWKPTLLVSNETDAPVKEREDKQFAVMEYTAELDESMRRKRTYEDNTFKAYALLWECCAKAMQNKIVSRSDYDSVVYNDPIALLRAIKEHSLNYQETRYEMSIISDAFRSVFTELSKRKVKVSKIIQDVLRR